MSKPDYTLLGVPSDLVLTNATHDGRPCLRATFSVLGIEFDELLAVSGHVPDLTYELEEHVRKARIWATRARAMHMVKVEPGFGDADDDVLMAELDRRESITNVAERQGCSRDRVGRLPDERVRELEMAWWSFRNDAEGDMQGVERAIGMRPKIGSAAAE